MASEVSSETPLKLGSAFRFHLKLILHYFGNHRSLASPIIADNKMGMDLPWKSNLSRKYPTEMTCSNRATARGNWPATGKTPLVDVSAQIEDETWVDVSAGDMTKRLCESSNFTMSKERDCLQASDGEPKPFLRYSTTGVLYNNSSLATGTNIVLEAASALTYTYSSLHPCRVVHRDLKPANILLDSKMEPNISDFGLSSLQHVEPTRNRPLDAKFLEKPSAKRAIEENIGSHMTHRRTYLSVHHHPLIKMLPCARKWSGDIFTSCARLITSNRIFGMAETGRISAKPKYDTPNAGPVSEYIIRKLFGIWNGLTVNESQQHSDPDSSRSDHGEMAVNTKTSASWIVATAAPHHATGDRNLLSGFTMVHDDLFVHAVNRVPMKVIARAAVVTDAFLLPDVWYVPGLTENLVSVSQLAELDHSISFGRGECCIKSARDAKIVGKGRLQKGHYVLDYLKVALAI